jgi:hypothetical protein
VARITLRSHSPAEERGVDPRDVGYYRLRFPTKSLTLGELASLPQTSESIQAVVR